MMMMKNTQKLQKTLRIKKMRKLRKIQLTLKAKMISRIISGLVIFLSIFYYLQVFSSVALNIGEANVWINHHHYANASDGTKNIYVITKTKFLLKFQRAKVSSNDSMHVVVPKDTSFIVSLPANETVASRWEVLNQPPIYLGYEYVNPSVFNVGIDKKTGESARRENMVFKATEEGTQDITLKYMGIGMPQQESDFTVGVKIQVR